jgi:nucleoside-diphosphate-sugar epimerase
LPLQAARGSSDATSLAGLPGKGHRVVLIARGSDRRDLAVRELPGTTLVPTDLGSLDELTAALAECDGVAHCAGTREAGVRKIALLSFLRARPDCGSAYHESKWIAEELVRGSGLDFTVLKSGMIYGRGDHMLDHLSHSLHSLPVFARVGLRERRTICWPGCSNTRRRFRWWRSPRPEFSRRA